MQEIIKATLQVCFCWGNNIVAWGKAQSHFMPFYLNYRWDCDSGESFPAQEHASYYKVSMVRKPISAMKEKKKAQKEVIITSYYNNKGYNCDFQGHTFLISRTQKVKVMAFILIIMTSWVLVFLFWWKYSMEILQNLTLTNPKIFLWYTATKGCIKDAKYTLKS